MLPDSGSARQGGELAELVIRRLAAADWAAFREVRLAALRDAPEAFGSTASDAEKLDQAEWRRRLEQRAVFLAEVACQPVGLAAGVDGDRPGEAELISMWVAPAWRGHGVGQRRRPGHASRRHNRKATRMKPPTILVAIGVPPRSIGTPTGHSLGRVRLHRYPPG